MGHAEQSINQSLSQRIEVLNTGGFVASPFTGSASIAVLLFTAASTITGPAAYATAVNSATLGTVVTLFKPGRYSVELGLVTAASIAPVIGLSQDVAVAGLTTTPTFANAGTTDVLATLVPAATNLPVKISTEIIVPRSLSQVGSVIRFLAALAGDAAPALGFIQASGYFRIRNIGAAFV